MRPADPCVCSDRCTPVHDVPAIAEQMSRLSKSATAWAEGSLALMPRWWPAVGKHRRTTVIVLIPAHNEEVSIEATIASIRAQDRKPDRILVICDNCTDSTQRRAVAAGGETYVTVGNHEMKAGALNQALALLLPSLADCDLITVIDADTLISPNFISEAAAEFLRDPQLGGLSGVYAGKPGGGLVGWCQRNEFARWGFDCRQEMGKAICLSGAASIFTVRAIRKVIGARAAGLLPAGDAQFYNVRNFTEDFEASQAILHVGEKIANLLTVSIETEVKPTWRDLHVQRLRWNRGITETLFAYGWTRHTWRMWLRWLIYTFSVVAIPLSLFLISERLVSGEGFHLNAWMALWIGVTAVVASHKAITVWWTRGLKAALAAFILVVELPYDMFLHFTYARSLWNSITAASKQWR
jgi:biofilm PGA synthesis N-glycosyltransferase PgaC